MKRVVQTDSFIITNVKYETNNLFYSHFNFNLFLQRH
jgi:hypothetical protein